METSYEKISIAADIVSLLRQHLADPSNGQAFTRLVHKLQGLIYHSSLRRSGDPGIAEEVTQTVFTIMARKAGQLVRHPSPRSWVFQTTKLETLQAMRTARRRHRKHTALVHEEIPAAHSADMADLHTTLDQALDKLSATDRELVLLKYYEGLTYPEISAVNGRSESANKMRLKRALQSLSSWLKGHGVTLSITAIGTGLSTEFAKAAPLIATKITSASLAGASSVSTTTLITNTISTMSTLKTITTATAAVIGLAAIPYAWQASQARDLSRQISTFSEHQNPEKEVRRSRREITARHQTTSRKISSLLAETKARLDVDTFTEIIEQSLVKKNVLPLVKIILPLSQMSDSEIGELRAKFLARGERAHVKNVGMKWLSMMSRVDENYGKLIASQIADGAKDDSYFGAMRLWAMKDPEAAFAWIEKNAAEGILDPRGANNDPLQSLRSAYLAGLAQHDPDQAIASFRSLDLKGQRWTVSSLLQSIALIDSERALTFVSSLDDGTSRKSGMRSLMQILVRKLPIRTIRDRLTGEQWTDEDRRITYAVILNQSPEFKKKGMTEKITWADQNTPEKSADPYLEGIVRDGYDRGQVDSWLQQESAGLRKDQVLQFAAGFSVFNHSGWDVEKALDYTFKISDSATKEKTIKDLRHWTGSNPSVRDRLNEILKTAGK